MRVLITGSRHWTSTAKIFARLSRLPDENHGKTVTIIQGEADGADSIAKDVALRLGLDVEGYYANWTRYDKAAGPIRNKKMLDTKPNLVIAFHEDIGGSVGTKHMIAIAREAGILVELIT